MQAYVVSKGATSLGQLRRVELPQPRPGEGQILVRMRAAALNYRDQLIVIGRYMGGSVQRDTIPLSDGAGEVVETGSGVTRFKVGDRVASTFFRGWVDGPPTGPLPPATRSWREAGRSAQTPVSITSARRIGSSRFSRQPAVDRVFDFEAARDAYDYQKRGAFGKVVIQI